MITHINWGDDDKDSLTLKIKERLVTVSRFGSIRFLDVLACGKKAGGQEKDTVAFLQYDNIVSGWETND
jgi:hypothetical protein